MPYMNKFDHLETLVRRFIEGPFDRLFQAQFHPADLAQQKIDDTRAVFDETPAGLSPSNVANRWLLQGEERQFRLGEPVVRVGRALDNDIVLSNRTVSRYHAQLRWRNGAYHLYPPAPSVNGEAELGVSTLILNRGDAPTLVNQNPVTQTVLAPGDVVKLGNMVLTVIVEPGNAND
jgi:pSer/pThr/pTyr-binding forkhead associated (FHA) protein